MIVLSLGTNIGDRKKNILSMIDNLRSLFTSNLRASSLLESEPVGVSDSQKNYYNCLVMGECSLSPEILLQKTEQIERSMGRNNKGELKPRKADIDIILHNSSVLNTRLLTIPHHGITERHFLLDGLNELIPDFKDPKIKLSYRQIYEGMRKELYQQKITIIAKGTELV